MTFLKIDKSIKRQAFFSRRPVLARGHKTISPEVGFITICPSFCPLKNQSTVSLFQIDRLFQRFIGFSLPGFILGHPVKLFIKVGFALNYIRVPRIEGNRLLPASESLRVMSSRGIGVGFFL